MQSVHSDVLILFSSLDITLHMPHIKFNNKFLVDILFWNSKK